MCVTHEVKVDEVDECLNLLAQSFVSDYFASAGCGGPKAPPHDCPASVWQDNGCGSRFSP